MRSGRWEASENQTRIVWGEGIPYAAIHNFGGVIQHPGSSKLQVFTLNGKTVYTRFTKPHAIPIPQRMYMLFERIDRERIIEILKTNLVTFTATE